MAYGLPAFAETHRGRTVSRVLRENRNTLIDAADRGTAPIRAVSGKLADILGDRITNGFVGRMIRIELQPMFRPAGRRKWPRENGTESGTVYLRG
jgi:hypothetical protein